MLVNIFRGREMLNFFLVDLIMDRIICKFFLVSFGYEII